MTDILFGQSYYLRFDPKLWDAMQPYPPLGTLYAAALMRQRGYRVALFDAMLAESEAEWEHALARERPRFAVIYEDNFNYLSKMCLLRMRQAAFTMIDMARAQGCIVIVCGADATDHAEDYLEAGAQFVLRGEGEATLAELIDVLTTESGSDEWMVDSDKLSSLQQIKGLAFLAPSERSGVRGQGSGVRGQELVSLIPDPRSLIPTRTPRRPDIKDLDALPFPAWDLVDVPRYRQFWRERHGYYSMNMVTTRGCPYHCNWCAKPIWGQRYNVRSPENVVAELKWLKQTYAPDQIWFADDIMGLKPGWWRRFADLVEAEGARVPFKCLSRVDLLLREGEIEAMARAGCQIVWVGAESGSQQVLDAMEKGTKVEQIYAATRRLHDVGVRVGFFLQFGYPGETRADIERTLQMVRDCQPDDIGMSVSYPLPGTSFHARVKDELGAKQNWQDSNDMAMLYHGPYTTAFYRQLHIVLHKEYRARKAWRALRQEISRHTEGSGVRGQASGVRRSGTLYPIPDTLYPTWRLLVTLAKNTLTLPLARWRLDALERQPHAGMPALTPILDADAAATPSPQDQGSGIRGQA